MRLNKCPTKNLKTHTKSKKKIFFIYKEENTYIRIKHHSRWWKRHWNKETLKLAYTFNFLPKYLTINEQTAFHFCSCPLYESAITSVLSTEENKLTKFINIQWIVVLKKCLPEWLIWNIPTWNQNQRAVMGHRIPEKGTYTFL